MAQKSQSNFQSTQPGASNSTHAETQGSLPTTFSPEAHSQDHPPPLHGHWVSTQEPLQSILTHRVSVQESPPASSPPRVSILDLLPPLSPCRVSIQEPPPVLSSCRVSIQEPLTFSYSRRASDTPPVSYNRWVNSRDAPPAFQGHFSPQSSQTLANTRSETSDQSSMEKNQSKTRVFSLSRKLTRPSVDVPPSITHSPEASIESIESIFWDFEKSLEDDQISQFHHHAIDNSQNFSSGSSTGISTEGFQNRYSRHSLLPLGWRLLHEARKITHQLSLTLTFTGMVMICLISLGQPWVHFQVPLMPPGDPAGSLTIPINTIFFVRCPEVSCLHEYDQNAYLLDFAWAFLVIASITSFCLFVGLISTIFFTSAKLPVLDFFLFICSIMTGTIIILGVVFYLMQAKKFLQEGMIYKLGVSFYLAWIGVFAFLLTGFFSYLNYVSFWSILASQAVWT